MSSENLDCDVIVVGSGGGALVAACRAADRGLKVVVAERSHLVGGTTAISGGVIWAPGHHLMSALGIEDSARDATRYLRAATRGSVPDHLIDWFVGNAPQAARYLTDALDVSLVPVPRPDYHSELPGAKAGRSLDNAPLDVRAHAGLEERLRPPTYFPPMTIIERDQWQGTVADEPLLAQRRQDGVRTLGGALVGRLVLAAEARGVTIALGVRARALVQEGNTVRGLDVDTTDGRKRISVTRGVILASGGFEWSPQLQRAFLPAEVVPITPPHNEGDALVMAMRAGAGLAQMTRNWGIPVIQNPAETYEGRPLGRPANVYLTLPGAIMVNRRGKRFVNEARDYHDLNKAFFAEDLDAGGPVNQPAWMIFDARYRRSYPLGGHPPGDSAPQWVYAAGTLAELAELVGIDGAALSDTVERFNQGAARGTDPEFNRGASAQDRHLGDATHKPNECLAPLTESPFYAVPIRAGSLGTAGGVATDDDGRVVSASGEVIPGLYAVGNASASVFGDAYPGAGAPIGAAVVRGFCAGATVAG